MARNSTPGRAARRAAIVATLVAMFSGQPLAQQIVFDNARG
jgi:hypothetical protein